MPAGPVVVEVATAVPTRFAATTVTRAPATSPSRPATAGVCWGFWTRKPITARGLATMNAASERRSRGYGCRRTGCGAAVGASQIGHALDAFELMSG